MSTKMPPELEAKILEIAKKACSYRYGEYLTGPFGVEAAIREAYPLIVEHVAQHFRDEAAKHPSFRQWMVW